MSSPSDEPLASARSLLAGADAHYRTGSYREAAEAAAAAGALLMAALDPPPALVASALGAEGFFRYLLGEVAPARSLFEQELQIWERLGGENDPRVATTLNNLAMLFDLEGNYAAARPLMERVVSIRAAVLEPGHPDVVAALNNLALLEDSVGNAVAARGLWERALAGKPSDGDEVAAVLNNLAGLLVSQGDFDEARGLYTRALDIRKALYGPDHTLVAEVLVNEAALLRELGEGAKAAHALERVISIWEKSKGSEHPDVAAARNSLAAVYSDAGAWERSRPLLEQVRGAWERRYGPSHPESVAATNNLALVLLRTGDAHGARELWEQALATRTAALSEGHPANVPLLFDLSIANLALGCEKEAREAALRAGRLSTRYARTVLPALSVAEQAAYLERHYGALASGLAPFLSDHEREAVELVLGRKGLLQEGLRRQNALTRISDGPLGEVARRLEEARLRVARTVRETAAAFREAERERERIERELAEALGASAAFGSETVRLADSWEDGALAALQAALPVHHAFVDVVEHDRYADAEGVRRYAAIVVGSNDWSVLDLGEGDAVDYAVQRWRRNRRQIEHVDALRKLLWRPLAAALPVSTTRIWIAPDGQLGRVPWAVLPEQAPTGDVR
ncbi:MAG TPA: tetratricopeptide repeat protein, partial [Rhodothermales bacterium]|nr:tetratricopeptide repeat protein [Rhodothermales bacterium]